MKNKNLNQGIYLEKVQDLDNLSRSILFLKNGFNWSSNYSKKLFKSVTKNTQRINFFGFNLIDNNSRLIGSVLTFYQGSVFIDNKEIYIINLSSWYLSEEERGYKAIYMMKKVSQELSDFIVTNYSPSKPTELILKALGFRKCNTNTINFYFLKFLTRIIFMPFLYKNFPISCDYDNRNLIFNSNHVNFRDAESIALKIKGEEVNLCISKSIIEKKFLGIYLRISRLNILWSSNDELLKQNLEVIIIFLFMKYKCFLISCHCLDKYKKYRIWRSHYIKSPNKENLKIPILGSEFSNGIKLSPF